MSTEPQPKRRRATERAERYARRHWRDILWREWRACTDKDNAQRVWDLVWDTRLDWRLGAAFAAPVALLASLCVPLAAPDPQTAAAALLASLSVVPLGAIVSQAAGWSGRNWASALAGLFGRPYTFRRVLFWWRRRSDPAVVELALREALRRRSTSEPAWEEPLRLLEDACRGDRPLDEHIADLGHTSWVVRWVAWYRLASNPDESVPAMLARVADMPVVVRRTIRDLLKLIWGRFEALYAPKADRLMCSRCLVRPGRFEMEVPHCGRLDAYGCRSCHSVADLVEQAGRLVCVLDSRSDTERIETGRDLWVNWLVAARRDRFEGAHLFDFDRVEIARATDDEVSHFLVDIVNDTDKLRRKRYPTMTCRVSPECDLSANTLAALKGAFGKVAVGGDGPVGLSI